MPKVRTKLCYNALTKIKTRAISNSSIESRSSSCEMYDVMHGVGVGGGAAGPAA